MDDLSKRIYEQPEVREVLELVGKIASSWNVIELDWYLILTGLMHETPRPMVDHIYKFFITGAMQRDFVIHVAKSVFVEDSSLDEGDKKPVCRH